MSDTIWLITEDENDYKIVRCIIEEKLKLPIKVKWRSPSGKTPGLSRLAVELKQLIADARKLRSGNDCIAVLHDEDIHYQPRRDNYNRIRNICESEGVSLIVAKDEVEAWLLSDSGVSAWLNKRVKTWNNDPKPSDDLKSLMNSQYRLRYPRDLDRLLERLKGDGRNQSFQDALTELYNGPCMK
jgi:hypothetical protein